MSRGRLLKPICSSRHPAVSSVNFAGVTNKDTVDPSATVTIRRPRGLVGAIRKFPVLCDGVEVARVTNNATVTFSVPAGRHAFLVKFDWLCAKPLEVTLAPGEHLHLICASPDDFAQSMLATFGASNTYLQLRPQNASDRESNSTIAGVSRFPWGKVVIQSAVWLAIVTMISVIMMAIIMNSDSSEQLQESRSQITGQIAGFLVVIGWALIAFRAFNNHNRKN